MKKMFGKNPSDIMNAKQIMTFRLFYGYLICEFSESLLMIEMTVTFYGLIII